MIKKILPAALAMLALASCQGTPGTTTARPPADSTPVTNSTLSSGARADNTFAVLITYKPAEKARIADKIGEQSEQLDNWYGAGLAENVYYKPSVQIQGADSLPLVSFFIRAADEYGARSILDTAVMVKNNYATYELRPVGQLAMRRTDAASDLALKKGHVFAVIYDFKKGWKDAPAAVIKQQAARDSLLNAQGVIENAYVDRTGENVNQYAAVYFVNAADMAEARTLINNMPVIKGGYASVRIHEAGSFMKGRVR